MSVPGATPLGEILLQQKLITPVQLDNALGEQLRCRSRLGDILVTSGTVSMFTLYKAVANHYGLPFVDLSKQPIQKSLLKESELHDYIRLRVLPWKQEDGITTLVTSEPDDEVNAFAESHYGRGKVKLAITSPFDLRQAIEQSFSENLSDESRLSLYRRMPIASAQRTFLPGQKLAFMFLLTLYTLLLIFAPALTVMMTIALLHGIYGATMVFKWMIFIIGQKYPPPVNARIETQNLPADDMLPVYTILVPLYREVESLPHLVQSLSALDYPASKLDIKLVLEEDDEETFEAAKELSPPWNMEIIRVPYSEPRTKPKACNYALHFARGEFVTIYDAEDEPDPLQLKKVVRAFRALSKDVACIQSRLNYYNAPDNLLTRWFALEYAILFNALLPGLQTLTIPIPLGGTSNHLALKQLRELGEWDPYNVTEDADLGIRLAADGMKTAVLESTTMEEAPIHVGPWLKQRSRWIKGYMQTWLVHMRTPGRLLQNTGMLSFLGFQFFIGLSCITYLTAPIVWILSLVAWISPGVLTDIIFPQWLMPLMMFNLVLHFVAHWAQTLAVRDALIGYGKHRTGYLVAALLYPFYFVLHSLASYKALWQLFFRPHFWEKTTHGHSERLKKSAA